MPQIGNGRQLLAPVFVDDMGALVADALVTPAANNATLEVGGPETLTMDDVIRAALRVQGRRRMILHAPTGLMKDLGYGTGYRYAHDEAEGVAGMDCLPEALRGRRYYTPTDRGREAARRTSTGPSAARRTSSVPTSSAPTRCSRRCALWA